MTTISLNGIEYRRPGQPVVVVCIDGGAPGYIEAAIAAGMAPEEARHAAMRRFGGTPQIQERCRDQRDWS